MIGNVSRAKFNPLTDSYPVGRYVEGETRVKFQPCIFAPGSEGKLDAICLRYDLGFPLWHPEDKIGAIL